MASEDLGALKNTLPEMLEYFWSLVENSTDNGRVHDHSRDGNSHHLRRRTRPHMLAYFSSPPGKSTERHEPAGQKSKGVLPHYLSGLVEDNHRVKDLELKLKAVAEVRDLETKFRAIKRVGEWQLDQLKLMDPTTNKGVKRVGEWQLEQLNLMDAEKTMREILKLHNMERDKWKLERDKLRADRDNWKLTCKKLKDDACVREQQLRKLTMESQRWKAEYTKLATAESEGKDVAHVCSDLLEQLHLEQKNLDLRRRTGAWQEVSNSLTSTEKLTRSSDGTYGQITQNDREKGKGKNNRPEVEDCVSQQQLQQKLKTAQSEGKKLEEVRRDLLDQLERKNIEIRCNKINLQRASKWQALMQQEINAYQEEINKLKTTEVSECIICTNEFGEDLDQQRAYWKDCNHANICYKCTKTLWSSNKRNCPTCKTPASSMPTRLPPKIYL